MSQDYFDSSTQRPWVLGPHAFKMFALFVASRFTLQWTNSSAVNDFDQFLSPPPLCFRRSKDIVEPMLKTQWFVDSGRMAEEAVASVETGRLKILPEVHKKVWYNWLRNIR